MIEKEIKQGDILSESSHYRVKNILGTSVILELFESKNEVSIDKDSLHNFCNTADSYSTEVKVTKEDKKDGTLGIRSIWENIYNNKVFTVCFKKQDTKKSNKQFTTEVNALAEQMCKEIDQVKASKKGVADWAKKTLYALMSNPIPKIVEGEDRILVPSPKVETYDLKPEMSAYEVRENVVNAIESQKYDLMYIFSCIHS